jgi:hypothetical protein
MVHNARKFSAVNKYEIEEDDYSREWWWPTAVVISIFINERRTHLFLEQRLDEARK